MLLAAVAAALLAAPAAAKTVRSGVHHPKAKIVRAYVQQGPIAGSRFYTPANRGVIQANRGIPASNDRRHYDDIFVLDP